MSSHHASIRCELTWQNNGRSLWEQASVSLAASPMGSDLQPMLLHDGCVVSLSKADELHTTVLQTHAPCAWSSSFRQRPW